MNANLIGIIILVAGLPFVIRGWQSLRVAFFAEHMALGRGCFAILTIAFGVWLISQGVDVAMRPKRVTRDLPRAAERAEESAGVFLGGLPYYIRDNQACEHLKADFRAAEKRRADKELAAAKEQERRAKANPQAPDDTEDTFERLLARYAEPDTDTALKSRPCCVSVADSIPASQFTDHDAVDAAISRDWLCR
jgi:hypothetical protein